MSESGRTGYQMGKCKSVYNLRRLAKDKLMFKEDTFKMNRYIIILLTFLSGITAADPFKSLVDFNSHQLTNNLFTLKSNQSNTNIGFFIGKDSILLIDPVVGSENNSKLVNAISELSDKPIKYVINTHDHIDHSGANSFYQELGATIVSFSERSIDNHITFKDKYSIDFGTEKIDLFHIASHSASDVIIHFNKSNVIFMGDTYMHNIYPHAYIGGSKGLYEVIEKTLSLSDDLTQIVTAHGRFTTNKLEFLDFKANAVSWYERIKSLKAQGLDIDDIARDETLRNISTNFRDLSEENLRRRIAQTIKAEFN